MRSLHLATFSFGILGLLAGLAAPAAHAGCGCQKPPPPPAALRPNVTYAGTPVTFFGSALQAGQPYLVTFTSGTTAGTASVTAAAVVKRDLADATTKTQLVVTLPSLPLGPTSITVTNASTGSQVMAVNDSTFTVAPQPLAVPTDYGRYHWPSYQAAVGRDGVVYLSLDLSGLSRPIVFEAQAVGYPLRFSNKDVLFRNVQGFLMQLLVQGSGATPVPGMFVYPADSGSADSDKLHYSRHEFSTYFLQHQERQPHAVDPSDGNWHMDGSRHVDHNHLILAIMGHMPDGSLPAPGATPAFDLSATNYSLFYQGLESSVTMTASTTIDSYTPGTSGFGSDGDVFTNGTLTMYKTSTRIYGDATAASFNVPSSASVSGTMTTLGQPATFMDIKVPDGIPNLGAVQVNATTYTINGPGSFLVSQLTLTRGANLYIDNSAGPVTLYVTGDFSVYSSSMITVADTDPEKFGVYMANGGQVNLNGGCSSFYGVVYAPYSPLAMTSNSEFYGAFVADRLTLNNSARVHYDSTLRGQ